MDGRDVSMVVPDVTTGTPGSADTDDGGVADNPTQRRRTQLLGVVRSQSFTAVHELSRVFGVSEVTVRNDLRELETRGRLRRVRGGAVPDHVPTSPSRTQGTAINTDGIGHCAASLVQSGDLVAIDAGDLGVALAARLSVRRDIDRLVAVTNSLAVASVLSAAPWATVVVTGGTVSGPHLALSPPYLGPAVQSLRPDILFTECTGVSPAGVDTTELEGATVREHWLGDSDRVVVSAARGAVGRRGLVRLCGMEVVDLVITDAPESAQGVRDLVGYGVRVLTV